LQIVFGRQVLGGQRRPKALVHFLAQDLDRFLAPLVGYLSVRFPASPTVNHRSVAAPFQVSQHAPHMPFADAHLGGRFPLTD
jgi:hypothetical protein